MPKPMDLTGKTFGSYYVVKEVAPYIKGNSKQRRWECICQKCNNVFIVYGTNLTSGHSSGCKSCQIKENLCQTTHGMRHTRLYRTWVSMIARCKYKSSVSYNRYGGVGIRVCDEWSGKDGFINFAKWAKNNGFIENAKHNECTLDRIDPKANYSPDNCRFVSAYVQSNNRSSNIIVTDIDGETLTLKQLAVKHGIIYSTIYSRWRRGTRDIRSLISKPN